MQRNSDILIQYIKGVLATFVFFASVLGMFVCRAGITGNIQNMPMNHTSAVTLSDRATSGTCAMSLAEHLSDWTFTFVNVFNPSSALLVFVIMLVFLGRRQFDFLREVLQKSFFPFQQYDRFHPDVGLYNFFRIIFARGIIQPKIGA